VDCSGNPNSSVMKGSQDKTVATAEGRVIKLNHEEADEASSNWEKCARMLSLNKREDLYDLLNLLQTLCQNILLNPTEPKFRSIKLNNKTIENRLINRKGGLEFLTAAGFKTVVVDTVKTMQIEFDESNSAVKLVDIDEAQNWLGETVDACIEMADLYGRYILFFW
jgi:PUB domain